MSLNSQNPGYGPDSYAPAAPGAPGPQSGKPIEIFESAGMARFLYDSDVSIIFSTYQAGKLFFVGVNQQGRVSVFERSFPRCMGLGTSDGTIWMSSLYQIWRMENFLDPGQQHNGYDGVFVPVTGHTTGEIDVHDMTQGPDGRPVFVATRCNCLATVDERSSFVPLWKPPFIDVIVPEDRCHMNGAAFKDGVAKYVTCVAMTNFQRGWSDRRRDGGVILEVPSGEIVADGLSMPHSPRLYDDRLWVIQSGRGEFGWIDRASGRFEKVCDLQGFARGLSFTGRHALIGLSGPRQDKTFEGLELNERLAAAQQSPICGIIAVNIDTGEIEHRIELRGVVSELYDVALLPGLRRPMALGFKTDEIRFMLRPGQFSQRSYPQ
ncbi:TIGR03032 family protein [Pseudooceanicola sp. 216_PA32_1]|uniref:TIGR03032 family protein n=1 Tax=Pseudooceanicola pacificus TaxID=2676438 RepID=A0A844WEK7_9RHOB|nr:TIGR03032 family protein [Pseudooceanicola pacificus]MWB77479.1 TIGR03032 family protein [Pseudooceanicola pacificus]